MSTPQLSNQTITIFNGPSPPQTECLAAYELNSDGNVNKYANGTPTDIGDWLNPKSGMSGFECMATLNSGTLFSGTTGSWLDMVNSHSWAVRDTTKTGGAVTAGLTIQVREKANHSNSASCSVSLSANLFA